MSDFVYNIYLAGALFDHKALTGNLLLAKAISEQSAGEYQVILPQNFECAEDARSACNIRNMDLAMLIKSDILIACMDGAELDSGTVVEFCFAKALDIPAVLFRSDFRTASDQPGGEPWNLMCSNYPRTGSVISHSMRLWSMYQMQDPEPDLNAFYCAMAKDIIQAAAFQRQQPSWISPDNLHSHYQNIIKSIGGDLSKKFPPADLKTLLAQKCRKGLY